MKIIRTLLIFGMVGMALSCEDDFLDVENQNDLNAGIFWQTGEDANDAVIGAYSPMGNQFAFGRLRILTTTYRSDAMAPGRSVPGLTQAMNFTVDPAWGNLATSWAEFWKVVARANNILAEVPGIEDPSFSDELRNAFLGEAHFLRALQYFYLITQFRNVPLIVDVGNTEELIAPPSPPEEVWQQIIADLEAAKGLLPEAWDDANAGRATWGAATALLGKTYLYRSGIEGVNEYPQAAAEFREVIDAGIYELTDNMLDNFLSGSNPEFGDNNKESVFEVQLDNTQAGWGADSPSDLRTGAWEPDLAPPGFTSQTGVFANQFVLDAFLAEADNDGGEDPRARETLLFNYPGSMVYETPFLEAFEDSTVIGIRKGLDFRPGKAQSDFGFGSLADGSNAGSSINWKMIRYADVLLMYAEAENEANGGSTQALAALNEVRARSNMPARTASDQATLREQIRNERLLELVFEGDRYMDLLRWGMIPDAITLDLRAALGFIDYQPGREYLPIPVSELNTNPEYSQNPGY